MAILHRISHGIVINKKIEQKVILAKWMATDSEVIIMITGTGTGTPSVLCGGGTFRRPVSYCLWNPPRVHSAAPGSESPAEALLLRCQPVKPGYRSGDENSGG